MEDYHRGIFMHLLFVEPCTPFLTFPPGVHLSLCSLCHPYTYPLLALLPLIHITSVCPIYTVDHLPIDSYCICTSLFILSPPLNFHFFCILNFTLEQVTFMKICNIMMFSFFSYTSNDTELNQIGH